MKTKITIIVDRDDKTTDEKILAHIKRYVNFSFWKGDEAEIKVEDLEDDN